MELAIHNYNIIEFWKHRGKKYVIMPKKILLTADD